MNAHPTDLTNAQTDRHWKNPAGVIVGTEAIQFIVCDSPSPHLLPSSRPVTTTCYRWVANLLHGLSKSLKKGADSLLGEFIQRRRGGWMEVKRHIALLRRATNPSVSGLMPINQMHCFPLFATLFHTLLSQCIADGKSAKEYIPPLCSLEAKKSLARAACKHSS